MAKHFRSTRRWPLPPTALDAETSNYLTELTNSLTDLETDVPYLPINKTPFLLDTSLPERYDVSVGMSNAELVELVNTLLTKLKNSGIIR